MTTQTKKLRTHFACIKVTEDQAFAARSRRLRQNPRADFRSGRSFNSHNTELLWPKLPDTLYNV